MARQPDEVQLLALALLNYADDDGYFYADPSLVRSALRPFDEASTKVRRCLEKLVECGWIEISENSTHGSIGRVVNFGKHQKIDRPNKSSTIKGYWGTPGDSTKVRRAIDEDSLLEGKGTGKVKEGNKEEYLKCDEKVQATLATGSNGQRNKDDWLEDLRANYTWVTDFDQQIIKARQFLKLPKCKGRKFTQHYFTNWLNRIDRPLEQPMEQKSSKAGEWLDSSKQEEYPDEFHWVSAGMTEEEWRKKYGKERRP